MRVLLTGGTGFIGSAVASRLRARGDEVRALVRDPAAATALARSGCELAHGDLSDEPALRELCAGVDAVIHAAAVYEVGVPAARREVLVDVNVCGTERVLGAALATGVARAVHLSTVAVFGNTRGQVAGEDWVRRPGSGFTSVYEQTKVQAHERALEIAARGVELVIVQPGAVYGPGDTSELGMLLSRFLAGTLPLLPFPDLGITPVHRDDVAAGVLLALDKGDPGSSYVLGGQPTTVRELVTELALVAGRRPPWAALPTAVLRGLAAAGPLAGRLLGLPPNLREVITSAEGVTFWASSDKAVRELGWMSRPLADGLADLVESTR